MTRKTHPLARLLLEDSGKPGPRPAELHPGVSWLLNASREQASTSAARGLRAYTNDIPAPRGLSLLSQEVTDETL